MNKAKYTNFGACLVSMNLYEKKGRLKWCVREESKRDIDNGWRFFFELDTEEYLADTKNWGVITFEDMVEI